MEHVAHTEQGRVLTALGTGNGSGIDRHVTQPKKQTPSEPIPETLFVGS